VLEEQEDTEAETPGAWEGVQTAGVETEEVWVGGAERGKTEEMSVAER
jgi:hypothetical protein